MGNLIIVESPAKIKTLSKFIGKNFKIKSSVGHLIDLPKSKLGVDVEHDFTPSYVAIKGKNKILKELKECAKKADNIYLATDPDREGEAIAWHIANNISADKNKKMYRVLFNQITKDAVINAINNPGIINKDKVDAQQARRILDRLVGYKISPILWKKVRRGLSAGRVQSVALRIICDREAEIKAFVQEEYWSIEALFKTEGEKEFPAFLFSVKGEKTDIKDEARAKAILEDIKDAEFVLDKIQKKEKKRNPFPPFITSTLQQEAAKKFRFGASFTMGLAQKLYEGVEIGSEGHVGLITYMRTDSTRIADEALAEARRLITEKYGDAYLPERPNFYKNKKGSQDAHEAIRPTSIFREPSSVEKYLTSDEAKIYKLIWNRFISSQMKSAIIDTTSVDIKGKDYIFRANGYSIKFMGFMTIYNESSDDTGSANTENAQLSAADEKDGKILPPLNEGDKAVISNIEKFQHFTQPPPRYSEANLIKELEEKGIGRPSTYAQIVSVIRERDYVKNENGKLVPLELGLIVTSLLVENFSNILDVAFTAEMETNLDDIEDGKKGWVTTLKEFYKPFEAALTKAEVDMKNMKVEIEPTEEVCDKCGGKMGIRWGKFGKFLACMSYPDCKNTKQIVTGADGEIKIEEKISEVSDEVCELCGSPMLIKIGRFGKFLSCSKYPGCKSTKNIGIGVKCPECGSDIAMRGSKKGVFYGCSGYPKCRFALWNKPIPRECPLCSYPILVEKITKKEGKVIQCAKKGCKYKEVTEPLMEDKELTVT